jgi:AraC family transcriptional regulator of adaptative response/methylated-DNA-[protein]-cysteine methyltransferase
MKDQVNLFNEKSSDILNKGVLKERIQNTHLLAINPSFMVKRWMPEDEHLPIVYKMEETPVGRLLIAATVKGIIHIGFITKNHTAALADLKRRFPSNIIAEGNNEWITIALEHINNPESQTPLQLHLKGTDFQLSVWEKLILIPFGGLTNYKQLGDNESNSRAIGGAVGANPIGYLVPCHRVIRADGSFNGFFWGNDIKANLLTYEATCAVN